MFYNHNKIIAKLFVILFVVIETGIAINAPNNNPFHDYLYIRNDSEAYDRFVKMPTQTQWKMYFFNIDNPEAFEHLSNRTDVRVLRYTEKGPYVYDEIREKLKIEFGPDGNNVTYVEKRSFKFDVVQSGKGLHASDVITVVEPALGAEKEHLPKIEEKFKTGSFKSIATAESVENIAFKGMQSLMGASLFGVKNRDIVATIDTGKENINNIGQYLKYGEDFRDQKVWPGKNDTTCNELKGTDATQFRPGFNLSEILYAFEPMFCKSLKYVYNDKVLKNVKVHRIDTVRFFASDNNYVKNHCTCLEENFDDCHKYLLNLRNCGPLRGLVNLLAGTPYYHSVGSQINVPPKPLTHENYATILDIEPITGLVLASKKRFQLNIQLRRESTPFLSNLKEKLAWIPLVWVEESGEIDEHYAKLLKGHLSEIAASRDHTSIKVQFSTNVHKIENNHQFVATCTISGYTPTEKDTYQVRFDSSERTLAAYDCKSPNGELIHIMIFTSTDNAAIAATAGDHYAIPKFDVKLVAKSIKADDYFFCSFIIGNETYESEKWRHWG